MRAFIALPVPDAVAARLSSLQDALKVGRDSDPYAFHITLAFLGERLSDRQVEAVQDAMDALAARPLTLRIDGLNTFGGAMPRMVFAAVAPDPDLAAIRAKVRSLLHGAGLQLPHAAFVPHVTLARLSGRAGGDAAAVADFLARHHRFRTEPFTIRSVNLYQSHLAADGATYRIIAEYPLV